MLARFWVGLLVVPASYRGERDNMPDTTKSCTNLFCKLIQINELGSYVNKIVERDANSTIHAALRLFMTKFVRHNH